jgi:polyketide synthase PksN
MDNQLSLLYHRVKENKISTAEALRQIKALKAQYGQKATPAAQPENEPSITEIYFYNEPYLSDHTVNNERVLLGATYAGLAINAFFRIYPQQKDVLLQSLRFIKPVAVKPGQQVEVRVVAATSSAANDFQVEFRYDSAAAWKLAATGGFQSRASGAGRTIALESIQNSFAEIREPDFIYTINPAVGLGDSFRTISRLFKGEDQVLARVALGPTVQAEQHEYLLHPQIINSAFLAVNALLGKTGTNESFLPFGIKEIACSKNVKLEQCWLLLKLVRNSGEMVIFDAEVIDDQSRVVAGFSGCAMKRLRPAGPVPPEEGATTDFSGPEPQKRTTGEKAQTERPENRPDLLKSKIIKYLTNKLGVIVADRSRLRNLKVNLMDLGLESARLLAMTDAIKADLGVELYPTLFFEYPSIEELAEYFAREWREPFIRLLGIAEKLSGVPADNAQVHGPVVPDGSEPITPAERESNQTGAQIRLPVNVALNTEHLQDGIAVIGMHGLFAQATDLNQFWRNLRDQKDLIAEIPADHWDYRPWYDEDREAKDRTYCKWGSFIEGVDQFDAGFFNISRREAEWMDPQMRLLLQSIFAAGEDAGYINQLRGTDTGVFVGVCFHDYADKIAELNLPVDPYLGTGNAHTVIANRVSFLFGFTGPSIAVDTACSSSLFALHQACRALRNQECKLAFVGGVNLLLASSHYRYFSSIGALSPTGRCHAFDEAADGYVPGEGIASILLKPLSEAIRDGDHIHAVIKGSAALHGGYTPSLTAPSVEGEENVILKAWEDAGINPETLTYIEAHGTGTKLGDPIEINSLKRAFQRFTAKEQFCAVGSAKAHIGHAEGAAGIAGVIKVILQMQQRQIPAMPQFKKLNPYIQLAKSPLYINQELKEWPSQPGTPRRAGVSSFGFSGAYAHVVIEEYLSENPARPVGAISSRHPAIIVLSAKTGQALRRQVRQLLAAIAERQFSDADLADLAYTLQVGREAMEERLGLIAGSVGELEEKLRSFEAGAAGIEDLYQGEIKQNKDTAALFATDEDLQQALLLWIDKGKYEKLLTLWVKGLNFDWNQLYQGHRPRRISLPTYPFAKARYWLPESPLNDPGAKTSSAAAVLHPLLHQNTSDLYEQSFSSTFSGQEFFLADHVMRGQPVLPGVVFLEMARAAVEHATGIPGGPSGIRLKNVVWTRPITVGERPRQIRIGLFPEEKFWDHADGEIAYEISGDTATDGEKSVIHSQGKAALMAGAAPTLDLPSLINQCSQNKLSREECYRKILATGLKIGPRLQGLDTLFTGAGQVLAKLKLPAALAGIKSRFWLHPAILDAALQATAGFRSDPAAAGKPVLPFTVAEVEIWGRCSSSMWASVRPSPGCAGGEQARQYDLDLCDEQGRICVRMRNLLFRVLESEAPATLLVRPVWRAAAAGREAAKPDYERHLVILCEPVHGLREGIAAGLEGVDCLSLDCGAAGIEERFQLYAARVLAEIQNILKEKPAGRALIQIVVFNQAEQQLFRGLSGILNSARLENAKLVGQLIELEPEDKAERIIAKLKENSYNPADRRIRYAAGQRYVAGWDQMANPATTVKIPWKERGIYLISGGAGGLGLILGGEIIQKVKQATLVLTGRSALNEWQQARLKEWEASGARVSYRQTDVTDEAAVNALVQSIRADYGGLDGIIHAAGMIRDNFIHKKTAAELQAVLAPKVAGTVYLDQASRDLPLDFLILFSSIAASLGNPGQTDYAAANAFMDCYAEYRNDLVAVKQRHGQTLSINWPLWQEGGMRIDGAAETMMRQTTGMVAMATATGIQALYQSYGSGEAQVMVVEGDPARLKQKLLAAPAVAPQPEQVKRQSFSKAASSLMAVDGGGLLEKVEAALGRVAAKLLKMNHWEIDPGAEFNNYGFDSITLTEFANTLNREYRLELTPALFFEYANIHGLAAYLLKEHQSLLAAHLEVATKSETAGSPLADREEAISSAPRRRSRLVKTAAVSSARPGPNPPEPIAVIGISAKFPMAEDIREFWRNLEDGRDCIGEIPAERWDWREYYGDPVKEANKTNIKWGGFIDGIDQFDPLFFGISPREAELMDPQQRLLMIYVWKAIEDAGYSAASLAGSRTGIFVGTSSLGYSSLVSRANIPIEGYTATGMAPSVGPNRMSYFLDFHGPSEPIETACSSSLIAICRAVTAIETGACDNAIIGGINTIVTPELHISFSKAGMLCADGRCKTFSDQADGYVRGEGVGMLFLKKLKDAEAAGDHIYGIIRGTAENHGGRANSLTSPNPKAQAELLQTVYAKAGVDPRTVGYIEAHGTGTGLGDPIEINGLKAAFKELYRTVGAARVESCHCGLGSVKTNIGHLELAAGVAGVIKVLLQLKHQTLVKSLHCETVNPYIQLNDCPFYIVRESGEWQAIKDSQGRELPRRAGVSSFGFGGVNAHVVLEEYLPQKRERPLMIVTAENPVIIALSAKDEERLREQARQLLAAVRDRQFSDSDLTDIAYTLQVGREAMEERLGLLAASLEELEAKLAGFIAGGEDIGDYYRGQARRNKDTLAVLARDEEMSSTIDAWIAKGKYAKLLDLWVKGLNLDWNKLYQDARPRRVSLPTYPFARERYWVKPEKTAGHALSESKACPYPGAKLNEKQLSTVNCQLSVELNDSARYERQFSSTFTGQEFFLADHVVNGQRVLPGVAYLEIARAAIAQAFGVSERQPTGIRLQNIVWTRPIIVGTQPVKAHIGLFPESGGAIAFEIFSEPEGADVPVVHSQGVAGLFSTVQRPLLDLPDIQARCSQTTLSPSQCYEAFKTAGIDYGPAHQGIKMVYVGAGQLLAQLALPASVAETAAQFFLHPSLLDAALQASVGFMMGDSPTRPMVLPFAIDEIEILERCAPTMWALIRYSDGGGPDDQVRKFDIDLYDDHGKACVLIKRFSSRVVEGSPQADAAASADSIAAPNGLPAGTMMLTPVWDEVRIEKGQLFPAPDAQVVIVGGNAADDSAIRQYYPKLKEVELQPGDTVEAITRQFKALGPINHIIWVASGHPGKSPPDEPLTSGEDQSLLPVFRTIKSLLGLGYGSAELGWTVITTQSQTVRNHEPANPTGAGLHGLIGSMAKEYPNWQVRQVDLEADCERSIATILTLASAYQGELLVSRGQQWYRQKLIPIVPPKFNQTIYRREGVYLVIGGAGGLGEVWTEYMITNYQAQVIWLGRRRKDQAIQGKIDRLAALGPRPDYIVCDAANQAELLAAHQEIKKLYPKLNGVIHSAIVLLDQSLANLDEGRFKAALAAKVDVSLRIAQVFRDEPLDFVLFFSSVNSFLKTPGQSNYVAGCAFKDAFARRLAGEWECAVKVINWGYWGNAGIVATPEYRERMERAGIGSIEPGEGMAALETLLAGPLDQIVLVKTTKPQALGAMSLPLEPEEWIDAYPESLPSKICSIKERMKAIWESSGKLQFLKVERGRLAK